MLRCYGWIQWYNFCVWANRKWKVIYDGGAYQPKSTIKLYLLQGPSIENEELKGIIPRMMGYVFERIINANETIEFSVKVSFLEIYNEKIQDLLDGKYRV